MGRHAMIALAAIAALSLAAGLAWPATAAAGEMTWQVRSTHPNKVQIEFYSQQRKHAWPGGNRAYNLNDDEVHSFSLNCNSGEKICYGAWVNGNSKTYWGVGMNDRHGCDNCCYSCDGDTAVIRLDP